MSFKQREYSQTPVNPTMSAGRGEGSAVQTSGVGGGVAGCGEGRESPLAAEGMHSLAALAGGLPVAMGQRAPHSLTLERLTLGCWLD